MKNFDKAQRLYDAMAEPDDEDDEESAVWYCCGGVPLQEDDRCPVCHEEY